MMDQFSYNFSSESDGEGTNPYHDPVGFPRPRNLAEDVLWYKRIPVATPKRSPSRPAPITSKVSNSLSTPPKMMVVSPILSTASSARSLPRRSAKSGERTSGAWPATVTTAKKNMLEHLERAFEQECEVISHAHHSHQLMACAFPDRNATTCVHLRMKPDVLRCRNFARNNL